MKWRTCVSHRSIAASRTLMRSEKRSTACVLVSATPKDSCRCGRAAGPRRNNMFSAFDERMMQRAIELAALGRHSTQPNPCVGCVITQGEHIVGEGWHRKWGEPHAEVLALQAAGAQARGATVYVTLEPHSYQGRTPPCTAALIAAGVKRVVSGVLDANPKVSGEGVRQLQDAGIQAEVGLLAEAARELNLGFEHRMITGRPRVIVKSAISLDGRIALANGKSQWI